MSRLVKLPDTYGTWIDPQIVTCLRIQDGEDGAIVVAHTGEGYAVPLSPRYERSLQELLDAVARTLADHEPES